MNMIPHSIVNKLLLLLISASSLTSCLEISYHYPKEDVARFELIQSFGLQLQEQYPITYLLVGNPAYGAPNVSMGLLLSCSKEQILSQSREQNSEIVVKYVQMNKTSPVIKEYIKWKHEQRPNQEQPYLQLNEIALRVDYWDKDVEHPQPPYIAQMLFSNGILEYYTFDPKEQKLQLVFKESYQDARKFLRNQKANTR